MLATTEIDRQDSFILQKWKTNYPNKALGLFRLYECFRKEQIKNKQTESTKEDSKLEEKVLSNETVLTFLKEEVMTRSY